MASTGLDGKFGFIAGEAVLDLINTVHWRGDRTRSYDALEDYAHLLRWCELAQVLTPEESAQLAAAADEQVVTKVRQLREAVYAAVRQGPDPAQTLTRAYARAQQRGSLHRIEGEWRWVDATLDAHTPIDRLARSAIALITREPQVTIGQCADDACAWVFLDTSRRGNRRWCSAASCGDRNRARQYYQRQRGSTR